MDVVRALLDALGREYEDILETVDLVRGPPLTRHLRMGR
jgi:hypothetical protein